jgi:hypothetical protein
MWTNRINEAAHIKHVKDLKVAKLDFIILSRQKYREYKCIRQLNFSAPVIYF